MHLHVQKCHDKTYARRMSLQNNLNYQCPLVTRKATHISILKNGSYVLTLSPTKAYTHPIIVTTIYPTADDTFGSAKRSSSSITTRHLHIYRR